MPPFKGKKRGGNHSSLISDAVQIVQFVQSHSLVTKISPGIIRVGGNRPRTSIKVASLSGCLLVTVRGSASVQEIRVYTSNQEAVKRDLENTFPLSQNK